MARLNLFVFLLLFSLSSKAQIVPLKAVSEKLKAGETVSAKDFGFKEYQVFIKDDTVAFYTYQKTNATPTSICLSLPGSDAENIYSYHRDDDGSFWYNSLTSFDFSYLPDNYLFVIIAKPGFGFFGNGDSDAVPQKYWDKTSLQDRVMRANIALNHIRKNIIKKPEKTVVFGYSEGFYVAAKLATVNKNITHLGIGGGGGLNDFYDFILFNQKAASKGEIHPDTATKNNREILSTLQKIMSEPGSSKFVYGYTYKRWASFSEPAIYSLVTLNIPIYQVHGSEDENTAVENAYVVPVEFAKRRKNNLTFNVYPNCNHSFIEHPEGGREVNHWNRMMSEFFTWVNHSK